MKAKVILKALSMLVLIVAVSLATVQLSKNGKTESVAKDTTYEQTISRGVIKAGYVVYAPGSIKDPNTGELSGVFVDTLEEAAKNMGMKVEWTEEVGWATMIEGLEAGRYDVVGTGIWPTSTRGKLVDFTNPLFYSVLDAFVRTDDNRFNTDLSKVNDPSVKIAAIDGELSSIIAKNQFPLAASASMPQMSEISTMLLSVVNGKADMVFTEPYAVNKFLETNPGTLKNITLKNPIQTSGNAMMIRKGDDQFKIMLNIATDELLNNGFVNNAITKYEKDFPGSYYRVAAPYVVPEVK